jgi:LysR family glycine cleavage system transcriptional activator
MRRLPLRPIEAFVVVARSLNLAKAAVSMNLTVPALSRRIQMLEQHLGVRLFRRLPRGLSLTDAGAAYFAAIAPAWDTVYSATEAARTRQPNGKDSTPIKVSVIPTFAANWLMPRLIRLRPHQAGFDVELETSADLVDLQARPDLDCAIRLGKGPWTGLTSQTFLPVDAFAVASPGFFGTGAPARHPQDLLVHTLIGSHHQPDFWREWFAPANIDFSRIQYRSFDNLQVVYEAAAGGMGIAIGLDPVVRPYLDSGRLKRLIPAPVRLPTHFHLVRRQGDNPGDRRFELFRDWLFREATAFLGASPGQSASLAFS